MLLNKEIRGEDTERIKRDEEENKDIKRII